MQVLTGFRDFYPAACASRNYLFATWREVARRYGFIEVDGPILEPTELYRKKSGGELMGQLYQFTDKGDRDVALRPEMTPTVARMIGTHHRDYKKPVKWFSIGRFFRFEKPQKGRLREFYQLNCDIFGEAGPGADAELIALAIAMLRAIGLTEEDFMVRISTRDIWGRFLIENGTGTEALPEFLSIVDKMAGVSDANLNTKLQPHGVSIDQVRAFMGQERFAALEPLMSDLEQRGLGGFLKVDPSIVRGLAYYTGTVFEIFDRSMESRALAGGGRYDELVGKLCDTPPLPAVGFGMGDVTMGDIITITSAAEAKRAAWIAANNAIDVYLVIADETQRATALQCGQTLRDAGLRVDHPIANVPKVDKQFQAAEQMGATFAAVIGSEFPQVRLKRLATREQQVVAADDLAAAVRG